MLTGTLMNWDSQIEYILYHMIEKYMLCETHRTQKIYVDYDLEKVYVDWNLEKNLCDKLC